MTGKKSSLRIHHIAITTPYPESLAQFYAKLPGFPEPRFNLTDSGKVRSVWFKLGRVIFMIEKGKKRKAPEALVFTFPSERKFLKEVEKASIKRTEYTIYFYDPDGNTIGFSSYPKPLKK